MIVKKSIRSFEKIIVRDENTSNFVDLITKKKPFIACDPSLLFTPKIISGENSNFDYEGKNTNYILIYGIFFSKKQIMEIKNFSKKNNLKIISICYYNLWADKNILSVNPNDFIFLIKNSKLVITSMFHGVMLSYKNKKNFWYTQYPYRKNKIEYFLKKFDLKKRNLEIINNEDMQYKKNENNYNDWIDESKNRLLDGFKK